MTRKGTPADASLPAKRALSLEEREQLARENHGLVVMIARPYYPNGIPDDILAEGNLGLCIALNKFDPDRGFKFSTYAVYWIRAMILEFMMRNHGPVRFGSRFRDRKLFANLGRARAAIGNDPEKLAAHFGLSREDFDLAAARVARTDRHIDAVAPDHAGPFELVDGRGTPEERYAAAEFAHYTKERILEALAKLEPRNRLIIRRMYLQEPQATLQSLGDQLGISRERVRQLSVRALRQLRECLADLDEEGKAA